MSFVHLDPYASYNTTNVITELILKYNNDNHCYTTFNIENMILFANETISKFMPLIPEGFRWFIEFGLSNDQDEDYFGARVVITNYNLDSINYDISRHVPIHKFILHQ